jgi:hypothetical protein
MILSNKSKIKYPRSKNELSKIKPINLNYLLSLSNNQINLIKSKANLISNKFHMDNFHLKILRIISLGFNSSLRISKRTNNHTSNKLASQII